MKKLVIILVLVIAVYSSNAQGTELGGYMFSGGSLGLRFGTLTNIEVAPVLGYHINDFLSVGFGVQYQYYNSKYYYPALEMNIYGGRAFFRVHPVSFIFLQGEYELLTYKTSVFSPTGDIENILSENALAGIGYRDNLSENVSYYMMLMYNFNQTIYTPYNNPVYRFGIEFAFPVSKNVK